MLYSWSNISRFYSSNPDLFFGSKQRPCSLKSVFRWKKYIFIFRLPQPGVAAKKNMKSQLRPNKSLSGQSHMARNPL